MLRDLIQNEAVDEDFDLLEACRAEAAINGWTGLFQEAFDILSDGGAQDIWRSAACIFYWGIGDGEVLPFPKMQIVARLYRCLQIYPGFGGEGLDDAENLVWSIAHGLKGVGYLSEWSPEQDPEVKAFMQQM